MTVIHSMFLFVLSIRFFKTLRAQDDCSNVTTCIECLTTETCGAWAVGSCLSDCDMVADAPCYDATTFPNLSAEETCQAANDTAADAALCANQTDCTTCTATVFNNDNTTTTCQWNPNGNFCASACGLAGCGVYTCQDVACDGLSACEECLDSPPCAWVMPLEGCLPSCSAIADVSCYTNETFPNKTSQESCQAIADASKDSSSCANQTDCGACTGTVLSDGNTTCQWFPDGDYCASGCDMTGCGLYTCQMNACDGLSCEDCLANHSDEACAWVPVEGCLSSCGIIADTACFPAVDYNASQVCEMLAPSGNATNGNMPTSSAGEMTFSTMVGAMMISSLLIVTAASLLMLQ